MKKIKANKKLRLNKIKVAQLNEVELTNVNGGYVVISGVICLSMAGTCTIISD